MPDTIGWLQRPCRLVMRPLLGRLWDVTIDGKENIPAEGGAILAPNHRSFMDNMFSMLVVDRPTLGVGKAEYLDDWKTRWILPWIGMIPIDRSGGAASAEALGRARAALDAGGLFVIFPEGTRSRDGLLHKGRSGAARLALETGAPLIPVGFRGTQDIQPPDARLPKLGGRAEISIGRPIAVEVEPDPDELRTKARELTDLLMTRIAELSGQEYVDWYAGQPPDETPAERSPSSEGQEAG